MMNRPRAKLLVATLLYLCRKRPVYQPMALKAFGMLSQLELLQTLNLWALLPGMILEHARRSAGIEEFLDTGCWPGMWNPEPDAFDDLLKKHLCRPGAFRGLGDEGVARPRFLLLLLSLLVLWLLMWLLLVLVAAVFLLLLLLLLFFFFCFFFFFLFLFLLLLLLLLLLLSLFAMSAQLCGMWGQVVATSVLSGAAVVAVAVAATVVVVAVVVAADAVIVFVWLLLLVGWWWWC